MLTNKHSASKLPTAKYSLLLHPKDCYFELYVETISAKVSAYECLMLIITHTVTQEE